MGAGFGLFGGDVIFFRALTVFPRGELLTLPSPSSRGFIACRIVHRVAFSPSARFSAFFFFRLTDPNLGTVGGAPNTDNPSQQTRKKTPLYPKHFTPLLLYFFFPDTFVWSVLRSERFQSFLAGLEPRSMRPSWPTHLWALFYFFSGFCAWGRRSTFPNSFDHLASFFVCFCRDRSPSPQHLFEFPSYFLIATATRVTHCPLSLFSNTCGLQPRLTPFPSRWASNAMVFISASHVSHAIGSWVVPPPRRRTNFTARSIAFLLRDPSSVSFFCHPNPARPFPMWFFTSTSAAIRQLVFPSILPFFSIPSFAVCPSSLPTS